MRKKIDRVVMSLGDRLERRDDEVFGQFARGNERPAAEAGEVVAIGVSDSADESVQTEALENATDLSRSERKT